ncbi:hypothetical protein LTR56_016469 [Elasticomyces elasticus]|nr:hypothetical protein LTR56_016469 [Elasticomyces elasticus]KAK3633475.1 hypothetical protein LTR22_020095 [Elasticomyces elasticus]
MADPGVQAAQDQQRQAALKETGAVSDLVRRALVAALPVAPEQYLTLSLPGTIVNIDDIAEGGSYVYNAATIPFTPTAVRQAEAKLVDGMMPLASIMIGNTGKSVARSYASSLDYLVPKKATISSRNSIRSPGDKSYDDAMAYLTTRDPASGKTPVDMYVEKQTAWAAAQDAWDSAKIKARQDATATNPSDSDAAVQQYNDWSQSHYRRFKEDTQARWVNWVCLGNKYNVEYNFGMLRGEGLVDVDSIMARIESSKQSMRASTIVDADGANELSEVNLTPKNWASLCKAKVEGFLQGKPVYTLDQVNAETSRMQGFEESLKALLAEMQKTPPTYPKSNPGPKPEADQARQVLNAAYTALYEAQGKVNSGDTSVDSIAIDRLRSDLKSKINAWEKRPRRCGSSITAIVNAHGSTPQGDTPANPDATSGNDMATENADLARPIFGISSSFSSTDQKTHIDQSSWGLSVGAKASLGFFSAGGTYSHDESSANFRNAISNCSVSLSFSAMVVNNDRPWLYAELFDDFEIDIGGDAKCVYENEKANMSAKLSPGPELLQQWIDNQTISSLAMYNVFPSFPTLFIVACDTEIEFTGDTTAIEQHFRSISNFASVSVGYGPFSASASFHSQSSSSDFRMDTTATG